jgi:putative adhesin
VTGLVRASTGGGGIKITRAGSAVVASTAGGPIQVERAAGKVTVKSSAGPIQVNSAHNVQCESAGGGIQLRNISGSLHASTLMGNISAALLANHTFADSFLTTGSGDITVFIPSNLGVTIRAENESADSLRRIVSDFPGLPVRLLGTAVVAEGPINGGGALLRIKGTGGTIYIRKQ